MKKRRLGISLYPERSTFEQDVAYLEKAAKLGFDLLFITLLAQVTASRPSTATSPCWPRPRSWVLRSKPM